MVFCSAIVVSSAMFLKSTLKAPYFVYSLCVFSYYSRFLFLSVSFYVNTNVPE